jgi:hypothetical protein
MLNLVSSRNPHIPQRQRTNPVLHTPTVHNGGPL